MPFHARNHVRNHARKKKRRKKSGYPYPNDFDTKKDALRVPEDVSDFVVPPDNPPGFGTLRPELMYQSPLLTGQILFDNPFYTVPPPPPYGAQDPTWPAYQKVLSAAEKRQELCPPGQETQACRNSRLEYFAAMNEYAVALDKHWGLCRFQKTQQKGGQGSTSWIHE